MGGLFPSFLEGNLSFFDHIVLLNKRAITKWSLLSLNLY